MNRFMEEKVKPEIEIPKKIKAHLEAQDVYLEKMITSGYDHMSIHAYREAIRRLRALLYFYRPCLRIVDFSHLDELSQHNFSQTSLIREIDVFENGYSAYMKPEVIEKLGLLKKPLIEKLMLASESMKAFQFGQIEIRLRACIGEMPYETWEKKRHHEVMQDFIGMNTVPEENQLERYIHEKRSLVKKIRNVHKILMNDCISLVSINMALDSFQDVARRLHDTCVNLRFIGQYELDDALLLEKLIEDHNSLLIESDEKYEHASNLLKAYIEKSEA